jgi:hypothetical protein
MLYIPPNYAGPAEIVPSQKPEPEIASADRLRAPLVNPISKYNIPKQ